MKVYYYKIAGLLVFSAVFFSPACREKAGNYENIHPAHIEAVEGSEFSLLELTDKAIERTDIKIGEVTEEMTSHSAPQMRLVAPYGALIYGPHGETWVYTQPKSHAFIRHEIKVDYIEGDKMILHGGPPVGTKVVIQGAAKLYGNEYKVGH